MTPLILVLGLAVAISAAARSTWSPCGLSMLSSLTPLSERGRGHRYHTTVAWFIAGGLVGGCIFGMSAALLAVGVRALAPSSEIVLATAALAALVAVASDLEMFGFRLPVHHRQVNERWLDQFRPWVYGFGFGIQIGTGLATYIMTAALYLLLVLAVLSQNAAIAVVLGCIFGLVRGLAVLLGRSITDPDSLRSFHRRFNSIGPRIRMLTVAVEGGCLFACVTALWIPALLALSLGAAAGACIAMTHAGGRLRSLSAPEERVTAAAPAGARRMAPQEVRNGEFST